MSETFSLNPFLLLLVGLGLLFLEFYLPGMVLGAIGALLIVGSVILFGMQSGSLIAVILYLLLTMGAIGFVVWFALVRIRRTAKNKTIYLESDQEGYMASTFDRNVIGKTGVALSDLKPSGHALVEGKQYQVASQAGYLVEGTEIVVIGGQGAVLIVKPLQKEKT